MQMSYWLQQLIVLVLGLEKPRKDYYELVAHHIVTLWLVGYVCWYFFARRASKHFVIPQLELPHQSHLDRQCGIHEHGYSRHGARCKFPIKHSYLTLIVP
jgi:hypothetical protein